MTLSITDTQHKDAQDDMLNIMTENMTDHYDRSL
jgi:hypothetical protein